MPSSKSRAPKVSCIICHHTGDLLYKCIDSIRKSLGISYEIIIVTSDEKLSCVGLEGCMVMHDKSLPARKRNIGASMARGEFLAFFDDDVEIVDDTIFYLRKAIETGVGMSYGKLWNMEHKHRFDEAGSFLTWTGFLWSRAGQHEVDSGQYDKIEPVLSGKSASCMIRADLFKKLGGFDEYYGILAEETDLAWRVWLSGQKVIYTPLAVGFHAFNTKFKPKEKYYTSTRVHLHGPRNYIVMLIKCLEFKNLCRILPAHIAIWVISGLLMILTGKFRQGINILRGVFQVVRDIGKITKKRKITQMKRTTSDHTLWTHIYRHIPNSYYWNRFLKYQQTGLHG